MKLKSKDLLQLNVTIIAGFLILITISATIEGGIPFLINLGSLNEKIANYELQINRNDTDPVLLEKIIERQNELKLEVMEKQVDIGTSSDTWLISIAYNPVMTFTFSMFFFVVSCITELENIRENEYSSKSGIVLAEIGFIAMGAALAIALIVPGL